MCTAMSLVTKQKRIFFGRTMDFSYELDPQIYIIPRGYEWNSIDPNKPIVTKYKYIGTGQNIGKITLADGMNENGLGVAALYFEGYAYYDEKDINNDKTSIAALDMVNFLLGNCGDIKDVISTLNSINIVGVKDPITDSIAPLHWIIVDKNNEGITIEKTLNGLQIYENKIKVLSNSPDFNWQMTNLNNYINLSSKQVENKVWNEILLKPFGQGTGSIGLPGDYTSPSRFVKTSFQKSFIIEPDNDDEAVLSCFHIMDGVTIPKGIVITNRNTYDYTQYTVFMNLNNGDYYFNTYNNRRILKFNINDVNKNDIISIGHLNNFEY